MGQKTYYIRWWQSEGLGIMDLEKDFVTGGGLEFSQRLIQFRVSSAHCL